MVVKRNILSLFVVGETGELDKRPLAQKAPRGVRILRRRGLGEIMIPPGILDW